MYPAPPVTSTVIKPCLLPRSAALRSVSLTLGQCGTIAGPGATGVGALLPGPLRCAALGLADARSMRHDRGPGRHWRWRPAAWASGALPAPEGFSVGAGAIVARRGTAHPLR